MSRPLAVVAVGGNALIQDDRRNSIPDQYDAVIGPVEILQPLSVPALFVRGAKSTYISDDDLALIRETFLNVDIVTIGNAGHWVHAEAPDALLAALTAFLYVHI